ncbi:hypothetical protein Pedsa_3817 [Pseudopedobacter saltans DSM 12145]|uniref:DUF983 domain-containing protein n=1 Tax=Pseudopedobacter saltans (strain ATCC 51119 / DSM 12145 / JCM 21818 / CCUG 39354 / LMG 10337 / NBRC 100064 / NCIMB 13643) TaxID=762903 RepID=F0S773_PSESL|nr:DUF983 domain-containing protein [Pseudopedobacter saltans]ADY54346.1 hypothetical protein Pedsa_3817 [Pseudopedobacter saltans DSM 12145]
MATDTNIGTTTYTLLTEKQAALQAKCPRCRRGDLFKNKMYSFKQTMNDRCPHCNLKFEREPGYFYVSMFVSYALNVAEMVAVCVAIYVLTRSENPMIYIGIFLLATFILSPFNFRYSRVILLYWLTPGLRFNLEKSKDLPLETQE